MKNCKDLAQFKKEIKEIILDNGGLQCFQKIYCGEFFFKLKNSSSLFKLGSRLEHFYHTLTLNIDDHMYLILHNKNGEDKSSYDKTVKAILSTRPKNYLELEHKKLLSKLLYVEAKFREMLTLLNEEAKIELSTRGSSSYIRLTGKCFKEVSATVSEMSGCERSLYIFTVGIVEPIVVEHIETILTNSELQVMFLKQIEPFIKEHCKG